MLCCPPPPPVEPGPSSPARPPLSPQPAASVPLEVPHEAPTGRSGHGGLRVIDHSYTIRGDTERPETAAAARSDRDNGSAGDRGDRGLYHRGGRGGRPRTAPIPAPAAGRSRDVPTARGEEAEPDVAESPASTTAARGRGAVPRAGGLYQWLWRTGVERAADVTERHGYRSSSATPVVGAATLRRGPVRPGPCHRAE